MPHPVLVFDLDGTLVDTAPDLINTLNHLLVREGCAPADERIMRQMISEGAKAMLKKGLELAGSPRAEEELVRLTEDFVAHYADNIARDSRPFPGLIDVLEHFHGAGVLMGVCTNKREGLSNKLLQNLDMAHYFKAVIGVDTLAVKKPHAGHVLGTIEAMGGETARAVMIGDSETDIKAARAAQIPVIAVEFGYSLTPVHRLNPDATLSHYNEFHAALASLSLGEL